MLRKLALACSLVVDKLILINLGMKKRVRLGRKVVVRGSPIVDIREGCLLNIGDGVTLNSRNAGYHANMHSPVKLFADRVGATITIGNNSRIHGTCIHAYQSIHIGENCLIAANCQIMDGNGHDLSFSNPEGRINTTGGSRPVVVEDNVWIGMNCVVLPGVTIGRGAVISACSVVSRDVPPNVVASGNPALVRFKDS